MRDHIEQSLAIERLAETVGMSHCAFARCSRDATGATPAKVMYSVFATVGGAWWLVGRGSSLEWAFACACSSAGSFLFGIINPAGG